MVVASLVGTETEAGYYAAAISLATLATMLIRTVSEVLFPSMAEAGGRNDHTGLAVQTDR